MSLFLDVPYAEKDEAKALGARWNAKAKKWYTNVPREEYGKFAKWILRDMDDAIIATKYIFIVEGQHPCWKCGKSTRVIGLGISEAVHIFNCKEGAQFELLANYFDQGEELHLAWTEHEENIPPKLRKYLMETYSVRTGYSKTLKRKCFANHCDHCGALQGNWFLFDEPDSPLKLMAYDQELIEQADKLKIFRIPIADDLQINWNICFGSTDYAYVKYVKSENLVLSSDPENECVSYEELYGL